MAAASYVLTLPLKVELWQEHILEKRLDIGRKIYNACLGEMLRRYKLMIRQPEYWAAIHMPKGKDRSKKLKDFRESYGVSEYSLNMYVQDMGRKFKKNIGSQMAQNIAKRACQAVEKLMYGKAKKVSFKSAGDFYSLEEKTNKTGFRYFSGREEIRWLGLEMPVMLKKKDEYAHIALKDKIKYCRLQKKVIRGKNRYFVQFCLEGIPPLKPGREASDSTDETARVGIDIGTSTIAVASEESVEIRELAEGLSMDEKKKRIVQRRLDRQRRANNPNKYNPDKTVNRSNQEKWVKGRNYEKTRMSLQEINRKMAEKRKQSHCQYANHLISLGLDMRVEKMQFQGLQKRAKETKINEKTGRYQRKKRFGRSISTRAPALLLTILDRKLKAKGLELKRIKTTEVKASQFEHFTQTYTKKTLGRRWNDFPQGRVQRDMYSAFLIMNTNEKLDEVDVERCNRTWENFLKRHHEEINRLNGLEKKQLRSMGIN